MNWATAVHIRFKGARKDDVLEIDRHSRPYHIFLYAHTVWIRAPPVW